MMSAIRILEIGVLKTEKILLSVIYALSCFGMVGLLLAIFYTGNKDPFLAGVFLIVVVFIFLSRTKLSSVENELCVLLPKKGSQTDIDRVEEEGCYKFKINN